MLALWLRHAPQAAGLVLDRGGWSDVIAIHEALARAGVRDPATTVARVVVENDKQRFELTADGRCIRARQGHSLEVQGDWTRTDPPFHLYHGTVERFVPAILAHGLKSMQQRHVHLSPDVATAACVGARRGRPVILEVAATRSACAGQAFYLTGNGVWLTDNVPPQFLRRM